jgi:choice-of-anchor B domain-containing protein
MSRLARLSRRARTPFRETLLATLALLAAATALGHEGDPKARERRKPFVGPVWREGDGGVAGLFAASGVSLKAWFPANTFNTGGATNTTGNDCWGYVSPSGREYAIVGLNGGTGFVEVTVPEESRIVAFQPGPTSLWRNAKTYGSHCYSVSEGGGGIQVFDLAQIDAGMVTLVNTVTAGGAAQTHTMIINEETGYLYRMGGSSNGIRIYSLANPVAPALVAEWQGRYVHDGFVTSYPSGPYAGKEIFFACGGLNNGFAQTGVTILDVTDKAAIVELSHFQYPNAAFCHQAWITEDRKYIYINDEIDEQNFGLNNLGRIVNVENLSAPFLAGTYSTGLVSVDHNLYVKGNLLFCSNYKTGLRIFDLAADPLAPSEIAWFDTYPEADATGYAGLWSNYPYLPSGTIIGSDIERGLFVWRLELPFANFTPDGTLPAQVDPRGDSIEITIAPRPGETLAAGGQKLRLSIDGGAPVDSPLVPLGADRWRADFPTIACGIPLRYQFVATDPAGRENTYPPLPVDAVATLGTSLRFSDDFETDQFWSVGALGDNATAGFWVRVDPVGTSAQPEDDNPAGTGTKCFVTGQGVVGGQAGAADVDGGSTSLVSPRLDCTGMQQPLVEYARWYSNNQGSNPNADSMPILISANNGATWVQLEEVNENLGAWKTKVFAIEDFIVPTDQVRLRFVARDLGGGSLVEAGVDDVRISYYDCPADTVPGDLNGDGVVSAGDLAALLGAWGSAGGPADLDGDGTVAAGDLTILVANWTP